MIPTETSLEPVAPVEPGPLEPLPGLEAPIAQPPKNYSLAGEVLCAVTGIFPTKPITREQGDEAEQFGKDLHAEVVKFCKFGAFEPFEMPPKVPMEETFEALAPLSENEKRIACEDIANADIILAWSDTVDSARSYLKMRWPVAIRQTPTGPDWVEPPRSVIGKTCSMTAVVDHPMLLLKEMNRNSVTPSMVEAVETVYPGIFQAIKGMLSAALNEAGAAKRKCPWKHELILRMVFGLAPSGLVTFPAEAAKPAAQNVGAINISFDDMKTKNQGLK